jgi:hypothetical protein
MELYEILKPFVNVICGGYIFYSLITVIKDKYNADKNKCSK